MFVRASAASVAMVLWLLAAAPAGAQGLVWNLPADGTEVIYGGTLTQIDTRPGGEESTMAWERQLVIRSVGTQEVTYHGETTPGRWLEFEINTGRATEQGIDPGPVGRRIFRVLVAEPAVNAAAADDRGIPNAFLPIVEGYVQIGDRPVQKLDARALEAYPALTLLMNYKPNEIQVEAEAEPVDVPAGQYTATKHAASAAVESPGGKVENKATLFTSPDMPFGLTRWSVEAVRAKKDPNQPRDAYVPLSRVEEVMEARVINQNAQGVLQVTGE
jgi:hypothetical protein